MPSKAEVNRRVLDAIPEATLSPEQTVLLGIMIPKLKEKHHAAAPLLACDYCDRTGTGEELGLFYSKVRVRGAWWVITACGRCVEAGRRGQG